MTGLQGTDSAGPKESGFKSSSLAKPQGMGPAIIAQGVIVDVNLKNWTVDVNSKFDRRRWFDIQVSSPYLHHNQGEGFYVMPEVGAKCLVCVPSDGTQPFVVGFIAPLEARGAEKIEGDDGTVELVDPSGKDKPNKTDASFASGRYAAKPGDIVAKTRDGNFLILHRGGVLQLGATSLAQRIFIPLGNLVMDISERYAHHTVGGSINWGLQEGPTIENSPTQFSQVFRVYANDKFADLRISAGKVYKPTGERAGDTTQDTLDTLDIGKTEDIVYEISLAPDGFFEHSGEESDKGVRERTKFRFFFDREGGTFLRSEANIYLYSRQKLRIEAKETVELQAKNVMITTGEDLTGNGRTADLAYGTVLLGPDGGNRRPVARMGDPVTMALLVPVPVVLTLSSTPSPGIPTPGMLQIPSPIVGAITGGSLRVRA